MIVVRFVASIVIALAAATPAPPWSGLPMRPTTRSGIAGDPVNIAFEGSRSAILAAFRAIGWVQADPLSLRDDARLAKDAMLRHPYPTAPVSRLFLFGRQEDFAVEHELGTVSKRDHARFWDTKRTDPATQLELWIGDASRDVRIEALRRHNIPIGTTHHIDPDLDAERSLILHAMQGAGMVASVVMEPGIGPTSNGRNGSGDRFFTDGKAAVIVLKQ
jgi:LssY-like putative type I secretion system component LssY